jgi:predicted component of type VI protein secretion system
MDRDALILPQPRFFPQDSPGFSSMDVKLIIEKGPARTRMVQLNHEETLVGRRRDCDLCIPSSEVSRRHCILRFVNGELSAEDLDSANGTYLNDRRITEKEVIPPGSLLQIGPLTFKVQYQSAAFPADVEPVKVADDAQAEDVEVTESPFAFGSDGNEEELEAVILPEEDELEPLVLPEDDDAEPVVLEEADPDEPLGVPKHAAPVAPEAPPPTLLTDGPEGDFANSDFILEPDEELELVDENQPLNLPQGDKFRDLLSGLDK